jgi:hypothetical protein
MARVDKPASGFTAFFVELTYDTGGKFPLKLTTEVSVVPRVYPFAKPKPGDGLPPRGAATAPSSASLR